MDHVDNATPEPATRFTFGAGDLPPQLDDQARFSLWRDQFNASCCHIDMFRALDRRFSMQCDVAQFEPVTIMRLNGTIDRLNRTRQDVAADASDDLLLCVNQGSSVMSLAQVNRDETYAPGAMFLSTNSEPGEMHNRAQNPWAGIFVPRHRLLALVAHPDDLLVRPLDPGSAPVRFLQRYVQLLLGPDDVGHHPGLRTHVATAVTDLVALALGAGADVAELARTRGLRAARVHAILAQIRAGFSRPSFTPADVSRTLGMSARYVNDLLQETGVSFGERVMQLRLQKARAMLVDPRHDSLRISDIAYACGFNETSYFNRCFRRRFGSTPREFRGSGGTV